jgi:hypothetical protein
MKRTLVVVALMGLVTSAFGQSVYLKVTPVEGKEETQLRDWVVQKEGGRNLITIRGKEETKKGEPARRLGLATKTIEREEVFNITVKNTAPVAYEYTLEWVFMASPVSGGKSEPFHAAEKKISLDKNAGMSFEIRSPKLKSSQNFSLGGSRSELTGSKFAGYVVRVRFNDRILAVESTDVLLKRKYQDPKAKWEVTEPSEAPKKKRSR